MGTSVVNPRSGGGRDPGLGGMDQVDQAFSKIFSMLGPTGNATGGGTGPSGLQPQPLQGDDLTQYLRSLGNLTGSLGAQFVGAGSNLLSGGMGVTQGGLDISGQGMAPMQAGLGTMGTGLATTGTGLATTQDALATLGDPTQFYQQLLSGNPAAMTAALGPTASNIAASVLAGLPASQAQQVGNAALGLQPAAAQALTGIAGQQAGIGAQQAGIGAQQAGIGAGQAGVGAQIGTLGEGIAQTGLGMGALGTTLSAQGFGALATALSGLLQKAGINQQETSTLLNALL